MERRDFLQSMAGLVMLQVPPASPSGRFRFEQDPAGVRLVTPSGRPAYTYLARKPDDPAFLAPSACCFHPLCTPSGERITDLTPPDHPHHRGVFMAWHAMTFHRSANVSSFGRLGPPRALDINRGDFWGWGMWAPTGDRVIANRELQEGPTTASSARLTIINDWRIGKEAYATERTDARWSAEPSANVLDLTYALTPTWDLTIDRTPFGGFCVRARNDGDSWYSTRQGRVSLPDPHYSLAELNWPAADWYAFSIRLENGREIGVAVVDHPGNPRSTWHNPRYVWMINPCIVSGQPHEVARNTTLTLRYRVITFDGPLPTARIEELSQAWRRSA